MHGFTKIELNGEADVSVHADVESTSQLQARLGEGIGPAFVDHQRGVVDGESNPIIVARGECLPV